MVHPGEGSTIGVFGGTFDPPHLGHLLGVLWALETGRLNRVHVIPAARHAFGKEPLAAFDHRMQMCRLLFRRLSHDVVIDDREGRRGGTSYTIDSLRELASDFPGAAFRLIVGSDVLPDIWKWREGSEVLRLAPPLELPRPGAPTRPGDAIAALMNVSSTQARDILAAHPEGARRILSGSVVDYILTHGLYRRGGAT